MSAVFWFSILGFLKPAIGVFLIPMYLLVLTPEDYGVLALVGLFKAVAVVLGNLQLSSAMRTFYFDYNHEEGRLRNYLRQMFSANLLLVIISFGLLLATGPFLYDLLFTNDELKYYPLGVVSVASGLLTSCTAIYFIYLKNQIRLKEYFSYAVFEVLAIVALQFYLTIVLGMGILGLLYGALLPTAISFLIIVLRNSDLITIKLDWKLLRPSFSYALPLVPFAFLFAAESQLDKFFIEKYLNLEMVGLYALLMTIVGFVGILYAAVNNAIRPFLYQALKEGGEDNRIRINNYLSLYLMVGVIGLSGVIMIGSNLEFITSNAKYLSIREFFTYACTISVPFILVRFYALLFIFYKKSKALSVVTGIKVVVMCIAFMLLIPAFGIYGALTAVMISHLVNALIFAKLSSNFGAPNVMTWQSLLPAGFFLVAIWSLHFFMADYSIGAYGLVQFLLVAAVLLFFNWGKIKSLAVENISTAPSSN